MLSQGQGLGLLGGRKSPPPRGPAAGTIPKLSSWSCQLIHLWRAPEGGTHLSLGSERDGASHVTQAWPPATVHRLPSPPPGRIAGDLCHFLSFVLLLRHQGSSPLFYPFFNPQPRTCLFI